MLYIVLYTQGESQLSYDPDKTPVLTTWMSHMRQDPAVKQYILEDDIHAEFFKSMVSGSPNYNMLLGK